MSNNMHYLHKEGYNIGDGRARLTEDKVGDRGQETSNCCQCCYRCAHTQKRE